MLWWQTWPTHNEASVQIVAELCSWYVPRKICLYPAGRRSRQQGNAASAAGCEPSCSALTSKRQTACKPGSVPRGGMAIHLGRPLPDASRDLPGRRRGNPPGLAAYRPYSVLLPVGFAVPPPSPAARCALTAPFHPCRPAGGPAGRRFAFCGTFPGVAPAGRYPAPCFRGARTFLPRNGSRPSDGGHPAVWPFVPKWLSFLRQPGAAEPRGPSRSHRLPCR